MKEKFFLIDGTALAYRSYFAMIRSQLRNAEGLPTGALFAFANAMVNLLEEQNPDYIGIAWDTHKPTFRHEMDPRYKANRPPQPEDLRTAIPLIKEMVTMFGCVNLEKDGYEADDLIGTLATAVRGDETEVFMVTPDKDFMQLVGGNIYMLKPAGKGNGFELIDASGVENFFGVGPESVTDVLALIGDTSDNVPGVPGIGKKGAATIIREFKTLEKAIANAPAVANKRARENLTAHAEQALKSRELVTIRKDVPDMPRLHELKWRFADHEKLHSFFRQMQFRTLARKYAPEVKSQRLHDSQTRKEPEIRKEPETRMEPGKKMEPGSKTKPGKRTEQEQTQAQGTLFDSEEITTDYRTCRSLNDVEKCLREMSKADSFCFDTETTSTDPMQAELIGIALSARPRSAWFIPFASFDYFEIKRLLEPLFRSDQKKVAHHFKYDYRVLKRVGLEVTGPVFDTMLAAYLIDSGQKMDMNSLARAYLDYDPIPIEHLIGEKGKDQISMKEVPLEKLSEYACEDADITYQLYLTLNDKIREYALSVLAEEIEFPLARILGDMESTGVRLDPGLLESFSKELEKDIASQQEKIYGMAGGVFNINSPQQLGVILFEKLNIPFRKKTATGKYSTSEQVLSSLAARYEIAEAVLEYRSLTKLKSTYVDALPRMVNEVSGRIHSTFNQHVTATGRLSSTQPNLQNIPVRTERGRDIRRAFVAEPGYRLLSADYSQVELRIIASMAGDEAMILAFHNDEDIHARTAAELFDLPSLYEVTGDQRRKAKEVNFGIPYGVSAFGLAQRLGISNTEGKRIIDAYFDRFPSIQSFILETISFARDNSYVETLTGRRRYIPDIHSANANIRGFAERTAVNMPIQGTAADLIKIAMIGIDKMLRETGSETRLLLQVHDELIFEVPEHEAEEIPEKIREIMEQSMELKVPLKAETGLSDNWLDAH